MVSVILVSGEMGNRNLGSGYRVPAVQVEQGFSSIFTIILPYFGDFSKLRRIFEKSSNMTKKKLAKKEEKA